MKKNLPTKLISLFLTLILSGILPTAAVFADDLLTDTDLIVAGNQQEVNLGEVQPGAKFTDEVLLYTVTTPGKAPEYPIPVTFDSNVFGISSNGGTITGSGTEKGFIASVVGHAPTTLGDFIFTVSWDASDNRVNTKNAEMVYKGKVVQTKVDAIIDVQGFVGTYDGSAHSASGTAAGINGENLNSLLTFVGSYTNAPGGTAVWSFAGNNQYNPATGTVDVKISKANANINIIGFNGIYDGKPHGATGTATGVNEEVLPGLSLGDSFTYVPGGTANWIFTGGDNYNDDSGSVAIVINKATPEVTIWPSASKITYGESLDASDLTDGSADVDGLFEFVDKAFKPAAGTVLYEVKFIPSNASNYNEVIGSVYVVTEKADAIFDIRGFTGAYDGKPHGATGTATGVNKEVLQGLDLGDSFTNVPGGIANWIFTGGDNYNDDSGSVEIVIDKATPEITIWPLASNIIYGDSLNNSELTGGTADVAGLFEFVDKTIKPNAGTESYAVKFIPSDAANYNEVIGSVYVVTEKADAIFDISGFTGTYDGNSHGATGTATGVNKEVLPGLDLGDSFTNVPGGRANWIFTGGDNYNDDSGSVEIVINKATPVVTWPTAKLTLGQNLESTLPLGGESSVPGTFTFDDPLTTIPAPGNFEFNATFTPEDTINYETLSGKISVSTTYNFSGVLQPINRNGTSVFKAGSTIPVKFQLFDIDGSPISTAVARISYRKGTGSVYSDVTEAVSTSAATTGNLFRYDSVAKQYIFNLSTKGFKSGTYLLIIQLDDGTIQTVNIGLK